MLEEDKKEQVDVPKSVKAYSNVFYALSGLSLLISIFAIYSTFVTSSFLAKNNLTFYYILLLIVPFILFFIAYNFRKGHKTGYFGAIIVCLYLIIYGLIGIIKAGWGTPILFYFGIVLILIPTLTKSIRNYFFSRN